MKDDIVLQATGLKKSYDQGDKTIRVLDGIDLEIYRGERVAIVGLSGSGKSTLLHLLAGLDNADSGQVFIGGEDIANLDEKSLCQVRNKTLGFVYQFHYLMSEFTAIENVAMPLMIGNVNKKTANATASEVLGKVGLKNRLEHRPGQLSGGERQRVAIARALVTRPQCVLADEPTGNLDEKTAEEVNQLLLDLSHELDMSFVIVTHNHDLANRMDRILVLHNGLIEAQAQ
ncbi:MAG: lipoprotein-releasing ABC transporter ATP-binding protein LolD [Gammaproteobacteria bacterium]|nr:lipoprotein-releasing ABC transporter ATP-binding protein LolD [Gammaproteobacteria bacterium]